MTIDDALKRMKARVEGKFYDSDPENLDDMKLGIEALEYVLKARRKISFTARSYLPGETEE